MIPLIMALVSTVQMKEMSGGQLYETGEEVALGCKKVEASRRI
jgi:hypothetical protein